MHIRAFGLRATIVLRDEFLSWKVLRDAKSMGTAGLDQHLEVNKILSAAQFGFWKDFHIDDAVFFLLNNIITQLDQRMQVGGIFCDLTKAFDCINHGILLN